MPASGRSTYGWMRWSGAREQALPASAIEAAIQRITSRLVSASDVSAGGGASGRIGMGARSGMVLPMTGGAIGQPPPVLQMRVARQLLRARAAHRWHPHREDLVLRVQVRQRIAMAA